MLPQRWWLWKHRGFQRKKHTFGQLPGLLDDFFRLVHNFGAPSVGNIVHNLKSIKNWIGPNPNGPPIRKLRSSFSDTQVFSGSLQWVLLEISWIIQIYTLVGINICIRITYVYHIIVRWLGEGVEIGSYFFHLSACCRSQDWSLMRACQDPNATFSGIHKHPLFVSDQNLDLILTFRTRCSDVSIHWYTNAMHKSTVHQCSRLPSWDHWEDAHDLICPII